MAPLTQKEVDSLVAELKPHIETKEKRTELGIGAYKQFLGAHPEYIQYFSKMQGMDKDNFAQSEGIKYYGLTLADALVSMLSAAANDAELEKLLTDSGKEHTTRKINKDQFMSGLPIFIDYFNKALTKPENKAASEKFLKHVFPAIANAL